MTNPKTTICQSPVSQVPAYKASHNLQLALASDCSQAPPWFLCNFFCILFLLHSLVYSEVDGVLWAYDWGGLHFKIRNVWFHGFYGKGT